MNKKLSIIVLAILVVVMSIAFAGCGNSAPAAGGDNSATAPATTDGSDNGTAPADTGNGGGGTTDTAAAPDEFDSYIALANSLNDADNISMDMNTQTTMNMAGQTIDMTMTGTVQMIRSNGGLQMQMDLKTTTAGQSIPMTMFYKDGYTYINMMNGAMKMKTAQSEDELLSSQNVGLQIFDRQYVKDMKTTKTADGTQYTFTVDGSGLDALVQSAESSMNSSAGTAVSDTGMTFGDATIVVNVDNNGAVISENVTMSFTMSAGGQDISADINSTVDNIKIGGANITFPTDLDSYTETPAAA